MAAGPRRPGRSPRLREWPIILFLLLCVAGAGSFGGTRPRPEIRKGKTMKGNHITQRYICANMPGDFAVLYEKEFVPNYRGQEYEKGMMIFVPFAIETKAQVLQEVQEHFMGHAIIELHGLAPGEANLGVYTDETGRVWNETVKISFIACNIGGLYYTKI